MKNLVIILGLIVCANISYANNTSKKTKVKPNKTEKSIDLSTAELSGKVIDSDTGEALTGVAIYIEELKKTVYTNFEGAFSLKGIKPGNYSLNINYISYLNNNIDKIKLKASSNFVKFELKKSK